MAKVYFITGSFININNKLQKMLYDQFRTLVDKSITENNIPVIRKMYDSIVEKYLLEKGKAKIEKFSQQSLESFNGDVWIYIGDSVSMTLHLIKGEVK